jgi:bidirectional [NiFe] hydrogenase diaphorase subunit
MPARVVTLQIDNHDVSARDDQSVIDVARENGVLIPKLCYVSGLSEYGGCRMCLVEVEGSTKLLAACTTKVAEGMRVQTETPRLHEYRRMILEMLFAERNHVCSVCVSNGHCEMQSLGQRLGIDHIRYPYVYPKLPVDASHPRFVLDQNRCILCTRCVRVCDEIEGAHTWDVMGRGSECLRDHRSRAAVGGSGKLHQLREVRARLPHRRAQFEKGHSVAEMAKRRSVPALSDSYAR